MTGCDGAGQCHTLSSLRSCCPSRPCRAQAGPEGSLAPRAAARGRLRPPVPRASPCHTHTERTTRAMTCEPGTLAASFIPLKGRTTDPSHPIPRGLCPRADRTLVRPLPPPCPQLQTCIQSHTWKICKGNMEACEPRPYRAAWQQLCPLPVLHGELTPGLGLGFIFLVDPGAPNKQLWCVCLL